MWAVKNNLWCKFLKGKIWLYFSMKNLCAVLIFVRKYTETLLLFFPCFQTFVSTRPRATYGQKLILISLCDTALIRAWLMFGTQGQDILFLCVHSLFSSLFFSWLLITASSFLCKTCPRHTEVLITYATTFKSTNK